MRRYEHFCSTTQHSNVRVGGFTGPSTKPVHRPANAMQPAREEGMSRAPRNLLGLAQLCAEVSVPGDAREGAGSRPRVAPAQHSTYAGGPGRCPGTAPARCAGR